MTGRAVALLSLLSPLGLLSLLFIPPLKKLPKIMDSRKSEEMLVARGIKPTANRIVVLKALAAAERPMSLSELEGKILSIDKSGIFRALAVFKENHLVHVLEDGGDGVRYELCRSTSSHVDDDQHAHFFCEMCRQTFCLDGIAVPMVELPGGYHARSVNYMVKGVCPACAAKGKGLR